MKSLEKYCIAIVAFILVIISHINASENSLPVDIQLTARYSGSNQILLSTEIKGIEGTAIELNLEIDSRLMVEEGNLKQSYIIPGNGFIREEEVVIYDGIFNYYTISVIVRDMCAECAFPSEKSELFYIITMENVPLILTYGEFYERLINEPKFAKKLGFIVSESKIKPGVKGLLDFRKSDLSPEEAAAFFMGEYKPEVFGNSAIGKTLDDFKTTLASSIQRNGRITFSDTINDITYGVPRAEIAAVVYYTPAWEEVWGYGTTDDDGYYSVTFIIPDGQSLYEAMVGIQVYLDNVNDTIQVEHPSTGLYMGETIENYSYNWALEGTDTFNGPAKMQWSITRSVIAANSGAFIGGYVDVIVPQNTNEYRMDPNPNQIWVKALWDNQACLETVAHEHGHHVMHRNSGPAYGMSGWSLCSKETPGSGPWGEGWAQFWGQMVASSNGHYVTDQNIDGNPACTGITDSTAGNVMHAIWDLYDGSGDEPYSYWSKMDDALRSTFLDDIYEYIAALKDQYASQWIKVAIENAIQLNLPPSPGQLLASAEVVLVNLPRSFELSQNYPNPFNPSTSISFYLPSYQKNVDLSIYNLRGALVGILVQGSRESGTYTVFWDGTDKKGIKVSSGIYFYRLKAGQFMTTKKMVLMK